MKTFAEFQIAANRVPVALRNNRDRLQLPALGLQEEAGKVGALLAAASVSGEFRLTLPQRAELKDSLSDILWYAALLGSECGMTLEELAAHGIAQLQARSRGFDPDQR